MTGYWSGKKLSDEHRQKLSDAHKGKHPSLESIQKGIESRKGYMHSDITKEKISKSLIGHNVSDETREKCSRGLKNKSAWNKGLVGCYSDETRSKISKSLTGHHPSKETLEKMSNSRSGNKNPMYGKRGELAPNWKGGLDNIQYCYKFSKSFKKHIRVKFNHMCFICFKKCDDGRKLSIHHIDYNKNSICNGKEWAFIPLCGSCHSKTNYNRWYWFNLLINYWAMNEEINFYIGGII